MKRTVQGQIVKKQQVGIKVLPEPEPAWCPECLKQGLRYLMKTFQVSAFHAVWQCENAQCDYPLFTNEVCGLPFMRDFRNMDDPLEFPQIFYGPLPRDAYRMLKRKSIRVFKDFLEDEIDESPIYDKENLNQFFEPNIFQRDIDTLLEEFHNTLGETNSTHNWRNNADEENGENSLYDLLDGLDDLEETTNSVDHEEESQNESSPKTFAPFDFDDVHAEIIQKSKEMVRSFNWN